MLLRSSLMSSVAFRPDDELGAGGQPDEDRIEVDLEDDETPTDPIDEPGDEAEDDDPDGADDDVDAGGREPVAARPSRAQRQFSELRERNRLLAEQNATFTRQLDELRRNPPQPAVREDPRAEQDRLALMSTEERVQYTVDKALNRHAQQNNALAAQLMDNSDRASFEAKAASNPIARKLAPEVERRLADLRSRGDNLPRDVVLTYLVGERAMAQMGKKKPGAQERVRREQGRPVNSRSDVGGDRRSRRDDGSVAAMERRLGDQLI